MNDVRLGIIGLGSMGMTHARFLLDGKVSGARLAAIADAKPARHAGVPDVPAFTDPEALMASGLVDAVLIATPHFAHTTVGIAALRAGLHVLVEKPISVHKADAERLIATHTRPKQVFAAMFNQRTDPYFKRLRELVSGGELGELRRMNWIVTDWFRTEAYYMSGSWRATWAGEGGGVLLNQCPHNLDMISWLFGQPRRVRAFCQFGRYHDIEVEDDLTAYLEFTNGATGVFVASTGEAPGTNRLEIVGERGRLVYEHDRILFEQNVEDMTLFSRRTSEGFARPATKIITVPVEGHGGQHVEILQNFVNAIQHGEPLIAPAAEGIHSVELANAMVFSTWMDRAIDLPLNGAEYESALNERIVGSRGYRPS